MTGVIVSLCGAVLLCLFFLVRSMLWKRRVSARPVLTVADVAAAAPGTAVVVSGHTASFPVRISPVLGQECVWYEVARNRTRVISSNYDEHIRTVDETWGDLGVYNEHGTRVAVTADLGRRPILAVRSPMVVEPPTNRPTTGSNSDFESISERLVEVGRAVVVTGVVEPGGTLGKRSWLDGTAQSTVDDVFARHVRFQRWMLSIVVALSAVAMVVPHAA
ncbi:hypothetical protein [Virgisporangium aurantiacum]|uniref:Uncharacterized protein n=1 Tax=Virgisporangium aurantiacum TaxID=175570 RepID=A0A8J3YYJ4_9ACTN|nr:hypothetical protein [Virgisporangium aurantiacum]GIJ54379.1 hypothetical protein Vau01_018950 [Virgisporangium aurantiacum]